MGEQQTRLEALCGERQASIDALSQLAIEGKQTIQDALVTVDEQVNMATELVDDLDRHAAEIYMGKLVEIDGVYIKPTIEQYGPRITFDQVEEFGVIRGISNGFSAEKHTNFDDSSDAGVTIFKLFHQVYVDEVFINNGTSNLHGRHYLLAPVESARLTLVADKEMLEAAELSDALSERLPADTFEELHTLIADAVEDLELVIDNHSGLTGLTRLSDFFNALRGETDESTVDNCLSYVNLMLGFSAKEMDILATYLLDVRDNGNHKVIIDNPELVRCIFQQLQWGPKIALVDGLLTYTNEEELSFAVRTEMEDSEGDEHLLLINARNIQAYQVLGQ